MDTHSPIDAFNSLLTSVGLGTIGLLLIIIPVVILSISDRVNRDANRELGDEEG